MSCTCGVVVISDPGPVDTCTGCLKVYSLRVPCDTGPAPGGGVDGTLIIDLSDTNDVTACDGCAVEYSIFSYDNVFWTSVSVTSGGVLTAITSSSFVSREESEIMYKVTCPCSKLSAYGSVFVCKEDLCIGVTCPEGEACNQTTGVCEVIVP